MKPAPGGTAAWGGSRLASGLLVLGLAVGGGMAWGLCFGAEPFLVAPWIALAPLFLLLGHRRAVALAWLNGLAAWLTGLYWIAPTLVTHGGLPPVLAAAGLLALAAFLALYHALFAWLAAPVWRRGGVLALVGPAALWVVAEWLRGRVLGGFPWNMIAEIWGGDLPSQGRAGFGRLWHKEAHEGVPRPIAEMVRGMLAPDPERRTGDLGYVAEALRSQSQQMA